jgi:hypothetical protein
MLGNRHLNYLNPPLPPVSSLLCRTLGVIDLCGKTGSVKYTGSEEEEVSGIYWHVDPDTSIINSATWLRRPIIKC